MEEAAGRKKRKGGVQQRMRSSQAETDMESTLHFLLMTNLAWGVLSASLCHEIAQAAAQDIQNTQKGYTFPKLEKLAGIQTTRNAWRHVSKHMAAESTLPMPMRVEMPYKDGRWMTSVMLPHELFAAIYKMGTAWERAMLPDASKLASFWDAVSNHPMMIEHPLKSRADYRNRCVPLGLRGDEVPITGIGQIWCRSSVSFSWFSLFCNASGGTLSNVMLWIWACFEKMVAPQTADGTPGTMELFWQLLRWSFLALWTGRWPSQDWTGKQLMFIT